jgi:hypothetical protein
MQVLSALYDARDIFFLVCRALEKNQKNPIARM